MRIGVIGAGNVGLGIAKRLITKGHSVMLSFCLDAGRLPSTAASLRARAGTVSEAVAFADVVVLAVPWGAVSEALSQVGDAPPRILWDCTNALKPDLSGLAIGTVTSGGEEVAKLAPWATVVKAIPPFAQMLHSPNMLIGDKRTDVFVCGDDENARTVVARLVREIDAQPIDAGPLSLARYAEPAAMLLVQLAYSRKWGPRIGMSVLRGDPAHGPLDGV
ncbi:F420-dependent NADP oxidoreductase [Trinickia dabaoshanensis]|uniref:F420-dependent NADP oxidoreductase n=1 Tax=Trinickia dabaoshanensis TaxID=564714 RepID=A0A2N7W3B8_9BURK|nr:NAD(P)-binding domain-containing protein [Trinickia dabaoshanensis]PMS23895.1 F420-dependent NADP oxidoreductase [Trinickia dabaoshanensis]